MTKVSLHKFLSSFLFHPPPEWTLQVAETWVEITLPRPGAAGGRPNSTEIFSTHEVLKEVCHEIFDLQFFFYDSNIYGPLINRLKYFRSRFWFCWDIRSQSSFCAVQCATHHWEYLSGVLNTTEIISTVCNIRPRTIPRTAEIISAVCNTLRSQGFQI